MQELRVGRREERFKLSHLRRDYLAFKDSAASVWPLSSSLAMMSALTALTTL